MHPRLIAILASSVVLTASLTACGGPNPADTCAEAFTILKDAKIDPQQWALNRGASVSVTEGKQKAEALARVAALKTDDKGLQTSFANIKSGAQSYQQELDKLAADPSREPNVQAMGAAVGFFLIALSQRCDQNGFKP
ncbi:hypothetical protein [Planotetraspora kaengkrachanensis]|uniref:Lipoprotein n=1 Tax=Planotetraspora kaengkrachanensis TaxID=575193 RepID=A0A8J3PZI5_9ACTN|nr:hypothetical protein [Planotetraspora kaengkrachanensis]GIG83903.1 hypothetical protein Pka01_70300 [Planotetraspora kaengkrachanensis]